MGGSKTTNSDGVANAKHFQTPQFDTVLSDWVVPSSSAVATVQWALQRDVEECNAVRSSVMMVGWGGYVSLEPAS